MRDGYFIGDLAKRVGMSAKALRYYEALGLLTEPQRTDTGYRLYGEADVERLRFIQGAKALGLSLAEIKDVLGLWKAGEAPCAHVGQRLDEKLAELDRRIEELTSFRDRLRSYKAQVEAADRDENTPCVHIAGAAEGRFDAAVPEALTELPQRTRRGR